MTYLAILTAFAKAGCLKLQKAVDHRDALLGKFRSQLKRHKISVERAYKTYDQDNFGHVTRRDFVHYSQLLGLQFNEDELSKLFEAICD